MSSDPFVDRLPAGIALASTSIRYWSTVAPVVRRELVRWEQRARAIEDPQLRTLALTKLHEEGFNAEAGAMLATSAQKAHRSDAVEAIVALELLFDYLDGLTERPSADPLQEGERLFGAYRDAISVSPHGAGRPGNRHDEQWLDDGGYLKALSAAANGALARLPGGQTVSAVACRSAERAIQAQVRMHAAPTLGTGQLELWARTEAEGTGLEWRELLAGAASSVLAQHALIAAAADPFCTYERAASIDDAYLSICMVLTLLDGVVDHDRDIHSEGGIERLQPSYAGLFEDTDRLAEALSGAARRAMHRVSALRDGPRHMTILVGVIAYYLSHPGAKSAYARPVLERMRAEVGSSIAPPLVVMRAWRLARRRRNCGAGWSS